MADVPAAAAAAQAAFGVEATGKHHVNKKCICLRDWCLNAREQHDFGQSMKTVPRNEPDQAEAWLRDLGYEDSPEADEKGDIPPSLTEMMDFYKGGGQIKVAMIHFYKDDTKTNENFRGTGRPVRTLLKRKATSLHQDHVGEPVAPIRPQHGRDGVEQSPSFKTDRQLGRAEDRQARRESGQLLGARANPAALDFNQMSAAAVDRGMDQCHPCRPTAEPTDEELDIRDRQRADAQGKHITDFSQVFAAFKKVEYHAQSECGGNLCWRLDRMTRHALAGRMVATCRKVGGCGLTVTYESSLVNEDTGQYFINDLFGFALATNQCTTEATACFLEGIMLKTPDLSKTYSFIKNTVAPAVTEAKEAEERRVIAIAREVGHLLVAFDAAHSCVVNAEHSTGVAIDLRTGLCALSMINSEGSSASRESIICAAMLYYVTQSDDKVDTPVCTQHVPSTLCTGSAAA